MKRLTLFALLLASITTAQSKPPRKYPEHGTVGSIRARTLSPVTVLGTGHTRDRQCFARNLPNRNGYAIL